MLGIEHPIIQGGMHYVGFAELAAAVSNAGGLGIITGLTQKTPELLAKEIARCRDMTDKPFGVNLTFLPSFTAPPYPAYIAPVRACGVKAVGNARRHPNVKMSLVEASELDTVLVMRALRNTERVLKNKGVDHLLEIEREKGASLKIADIHEQVAGVYPKVMLDGEMDAGAWSCGMVVGLIHDIPTVKELIDRIMAEAEQIIRQRLVGFLDGVEPPKAMKVA